MENREKAEERKLDIVTYLQELRRVSKKTSLERYQEIAQIIISALYGNKKTNAKKGDPSPNSRHNLNLSNEEAASFFISLARDSSLTKEGFDITLCSWGLLEGYQYYDNLTKRREHYLREREEYRCEYIEKSDKTPYLALPKKKQETRVSNWNKEEDEQYVIISNFFASIPDVTEYIKRVSQENLLDQKDSLGRLKVGYPTPFYKEKGKPAQSLKPEITERPSSKEFSVADRPQPVSVAEPEQSVATEAQPGATPSVIESMSPTEPISAAKPMAPMSKREYNEEQKRRRRERRAKSPYIWKDHLLWCIIAVGLVVAVFAGIESMKNSEEESGYFISSNDAALALDKAFLANLWDDIDEQADRDADMTKLETRAETGDTEAQYALGNVYFENGEKEKAADCFLSAANNGHALAQAAISYMYISGYAVPETETDVFTFAEKAADQGESKGQFLLGYCYEQGLGVDIDYEQAAHWYRKAKQEEPAAKLRLGFLYRSGEGVAQDYKESLTLFSEVYNSDSISYSASAAYYIGQMYADESWLDKDVETAVEWYQKAGEKGLADGWNARAYHYYAGDGVKKDYNEAFRCSENAANLGDVVGKFNLSWLYIAGLGVEQNTMAGIDWLQESAEQGYINAQIQLALFYYEGEHIGQNYNEAAKWFRRASEQGNERAAEYLQEMQDTGLIE